MTEEVFREAVKKDGWIIVRTGGYIYFKRRDVSRSYNQGGLYSCHTKNMDEAIKIIQSWIVNGFPMTRKEAAAEKAKDRPLLEFLYDFWKVDGLYYKTAEIEGRHITKGYIAQQRMFIRIYFEKFFNGVMLSRVDEKLLNCFFEYLCSYKSKKTGRGLARGTFARIKACLVQPLKWGRQKGIIKQIIDFTVVCPNISHKPIKKRGILTAEETALLLNPRYWDNRKAYIAFCIAVNCGLRGGEIRALRIGSIRPGFLVISHSFNDVDGLKCTKTGKTRLVPCPDNVLSMIAEFVLELPEDERTPESYLLTDDLHEGQPLNKGFCVKRFYSAMKKAGIPRQRLNNLTGEPEYICFHSLRHQTATRWVESGLDLRMIAQAMGHSVEMLEHYSDHLSKSDMVELRNRLIDLNALSACAGRV